MQKKNKQSFITKCATFAQCFVEIENRPQDSINLFNDIIFRIHTQIVFCFKNFEKDDFPKT